MKSTILKALLMTLPLAVVALPARAAPPEEGAETEEPSEEEALADDILMVIDLPLVVDEAREEGIDEAELDEALAAAEEAGVSAGDMTEAVSEETKQVKAKGKRKAFGLWVRREVASGLRGQELAQKIRDRKAEIAEMSEEEKAELDAKIAAWGKKRAKRREKLHALRKKLREDGRELELTGKERHAALLLEVEKRHAEAKAEFKAAKKAKNKHEAHKDQHEAHKNKHEAHKDKDEAHKDKDEAHKDKHEAHKDKHNPGGPNGPHGKNKPVKKGAGKQGPGKIK